MQNKYLYIILCSLKLLTIITIIIILIIVKSIIYKYLFCIYLFAYELQQYSHVHDIDSSLTKNNFYAYLKLNLSIYHS